MLEEWNLPVIWATKHDCHVLQNSCIRTVTYHMNTWLFLVHSQSQDTAFVFLLRLEFLRFLPALYIPIPRMYHLKRDYKQKCLNIIVPQPLSHLVESRVITCAVSVRASETSLLQGLLQRTCIIRTACIIIISSQHCEKSNTLWNSERILVWYQTPYCNVFIYIISIQSSGIFNAHPWYCRFNLKIIWTGTLIGVHNP